MRIVSSRLTAVVGLALALLWAGEASAQSTIAGQIKDATGAVMPGVTVEASSPVLIEKRATPSRMARVNFASSICGPAPTR